MLPEVALAVLEWLDRFSLDTVRFSSVSLKALIDRSLPIYPLRVLSSVHVRRPNDVHGPAAEAEWQAFLKTESKLKFAVKKREITGTYETIFRDLFVLCAGCAIEQLTTWNIIIMPEAVGLLTQNFAKIPIRDLVLEETSYCDGILDDIVKTTHGLQSLTLGFPTGDESRNVTDATLKLCLERGIADVLFYCLTSTYISDAGILDFCFGSTDVSRDGIRILSVDTPEQLSEEFPKRLVERCFKETSTTPLLLKICLDEEFKMCAFSDREKQYNNGRCKHYQFDDAAVPFDISIRVVDDTFGDIHVLQLRRGEGDFEECLSYETCEH